MDLSVTATEMGMAPWGEPWRGGGEREKGGGVGMDRGGGGGGGKGGGGRCVGGGVSISVVFELGSTLGLGFVW